MVLLYCAAAQRVDASLTGVSGVALDTFESGGVSFYFSPHDLLQLSDAAALQQHALEFHRALQVLLSAADIVPFRFPTAFEDQQVAQSALISRAAEYAAALEQVRGCVQLEAPLPTVERPPGVISGKQFMEMKAAESRRNSALVEKMLALEGVLKSEVKTQPKGARLYLLVRRGSVDSVRTAVNGLLQQAVSGPWPAAHFIQLEHAAVR